MQKPGRHPLPGTTPQVWWVLLCLLPACAVPATPRPDPGVFQLSPVVNATGADTPPTAQALAHAAGSPIQAPRQPSVTPAAAARGASRGGGAGAPAAEAGSTIHVRDRRGTPIGGATVLFVNGTTFTTNAEGTFVLRGPVPQVHCFVSAPGCKTSVLAAGSLPTELHLERLVDAGRDFEPDERTVRGVVAWAGASAQGGVVHYQDDQGSVANPVVVDHEGRFAIRIETTRPGRPTGVILAVAPGTDGNPIMGISAPFSVTEQADEEVAIATVRATRTVPFDLGAAPAGLTDVSHRLEIAVDGLAPFRMMGLGTSAGSYKVPDAGALGATVRISVEARDPATGTRTVATLDPEAAANPTSFLPIPEFTMHGPSRTARWNAGPDVEAVLLELAQSPRLDEPYWEGWLEGRSTYTFATRDWPTGPSASARLLAFDAPNVSVRHVASARQLRLIPEPAWRGGYRFAEVRTTFEIQ